MRAALAYDRAMHRAWGIVGLLGFVTGCEVSAILVRLANGQPAVIYQSVHTNDFVVAAVSSRCSAARPPARSTWTEEERVTTASLRAVQTFGLQAGDIVGDDGTFLTFTRDNVAACDTGDQDWLLAPGEGHILSATGDVYRGGCVAQLPPGRSYRLATFYEAGTTWGLRYADTQRVYEEMTGFTE